MIGKVLGLVRAVKRSIWLIATVAAVFVLQAPLCALACLDNADAEPPAAAGHACHEESSDPSPAGVPGSHEDCGCEIAADAVVFQPSGFTTTLVQVFILPSIRCELATFHSAWEISVTYEIDLPPPDILLLKSTLII